MRGSLACLDLSLGARTLTLVCACSPCPAGIMQEQRSKLDERMMAAVVSSIKAAEVIIAVVDSGEHLHPPK